METRELKQNSKMRELGNDGTKMKKISFLIVLSFIVVMGFQKVFSWNVERQSVRRNLAESESSLLLSEPDGILSETDAKKIIRDTEFFIAKIHTVQRNDWLEKIAQEYGTSPISVRSTNNLEDPQLRPNQRVIVQNKRGVTHVAREMEPLDSVVQTYEKLGATKEKILEVNSLDEVALFKDGKFFLQGGAKLWIPDAKRSFPIFSRPVVWRRISSRFGFRKHPILKVKKFHDGFDMVAPFGASVYAAEKGVVVYAGWLNNYGNVIDVRLSKITTRYGHLSKIHVKVGEKVKRKQLIGQVGSSGLSTGPHLHFEVRRNSDGRAINPRRYLY